MSALVSSPRIAAHLIVGSREEPFLTALLNSVCSSVDTLIVNDNAPGESPNAGALSGSEFARSNRLIVDRSPFVDFATARNLCLALHDQHASAEWVAFIDADEVHGEILARIASRLHQVPANIDFIDGYTWHFFQSFDYYTSIERRMAFFRYGKGLQWTGKVHEKLLGRNGARLALPYIYAHYGHTLSARRHAEKGRQYSGLGAAGKIVNEDRLSSIDPREYFQEEYGRLLRFHGEHPASAKHTIECLREQHADDYALTECLFSQLQTPRRKAVNALRRLNYEQRWRSRVLVPLARALTAP